VLVMLKIIELCYAHPIRADRNLNNTPIGRGLEKACMRSKMLGYVPHHFFCSHTP
jgi:hypothetical protein